jgi:GH18 family chitinase
VISHRSFEAGDIGKEERARMPSHKINVGNPEYPRIFREQDQGVPKNQFSEE